MTPRERTGVALVLLPLAALAGLAWLTTHPEAPILVRASGWPLVGPLAARFRAAYLGAGLAPAAGPKGAGSAVPAPRSGEPPAGVRATRGTPPGAAAGAAPRVAPLAPDRDAHPIVWVPGGSVLYREPDPAAPAVGVVSGLANLPRLERRGDWFRVRRPPAAGWVHLPGYREDAGPPLGAAPEPALPLPGRPPDPERLSAGRRLLALPEVATAAGPYPLYTDVRDLDLLALAGRVAGALEDVYRERYGLVPGDRPREAVLLFARAAAYHAYQDLTPPLAGLPAAGHTGQGIVALHAEGIPAAAVADTLIHEIAHLLNRRALGPALPPWLDEGIAGDLGQSRRTAGGHLEPGRLGGEVAREGTRLHLSGAVAAAVALEQALAAGRLPRLAALADLDWEAFVASPGREIHYDASSFWVRFLLDGGDPALAAGFRAYLAGIAAGGPAGIEALGASLGSDWPALEVRYRAWLRLLAAGAREAGETRRSEPALADPARRSTPSPSGSSSRQRCSPSA